MAPPDPETRCKIAEGKGGVLLCWYCGKVKGKRSCPARGGDRICSRCCGTKRRIEIRCPEDCRYLHGEHDSHWESSSRRTEDARFIAHFADTPREQIPLLAFLHHLLLQARRDFGGDLADSDVLEVVTTLSRTFDTLTKGILYEHKTENPRLQGVIHWMGRALAHRSEIPQAPRSSDTEILATLQKIASAIREQASATQSYLTTAERVFRFDTSTAPAIEIPRQPGTAGLIIEP